MIALSDSFPLALLVVGALASLAWAFWGGRQSMAMLRAVRDLCGGQIRRYWVIPSELWAVRGTRFLQLASFLGTNEASPSLSVRVFLLDWADRVPEFEIRSRGMGSSDPERWARGDARPTLTGPEMESGARFAAVGQPQAQPFLIAARDELEALQNRFEDEALHVSLSRSAPPEENTWRRGDPIIEVVSEQDFDAKKRACLQVRVVGHSFRAPEDAAELWRTADRLASGLVVLRNSGDASEAATATREAAEV